MAGVRRTGQVTAVVQDYLKVIWNAQEWSPEPVTTSLLADRLGVGAPTVSETVRRLVRHGWVEHEPYGAVTLTEEGRGLAVAMVRRHRLIETWLVQELGYGWDEVHDEAEELEHAVSDQFVERLDVALGRPWRDPHGDPIPGRDGVVHRPDAVLAGRLAAGERGRVARIDDDDPAVLRECATAGVVLDAVVEAPLQVSEAALAAVRVVPLGAAQRRLTQADGHVP
ncbi:MAG: DtxR family transcriptional regulator [Actinotalea sp.]|nr:DtxR family transcriptional regulator [Actinotalea sp.]